MKRRNAIRHILAVAVILSRYTRSFMLEECDGFSSTGSNPFFILEPDYQLILEEKVDSELVEVSRNHFAICNRNNSVVYLGEDVDIYDFFT